MKWDIFEKKLLNKSYSGSRAISLVTNFSSVFQWLKSQPSESLMRVTEQDGTVGISLFSVTGRKSTQDIPRIINNQVAFCLGGVGWSEWMFCLSPLDVPIPSQSAFLRLVGYRCYFKSPSNMFISNLIPSC